MNSTHRNGAGKYISRKGLILCALCVLAVCLFNTQPSRAAGDYALPYVGENSEHVAAYEDTMVKIARDYNLGFNELRAANPGVDPWIPGAGARLVLPTMHILPESPHKGIIINLPEQRFYYYLNPGEPPITHPIGVGREGLSTPMGTTKVMRKVIGPVWRPTPRMRSEDPTLPEAIGPGSDNPMGTHAMYLGWPEYAMHGTNKPYGIGRRSSSGCIRLYPEDIVTMYELVPEGTQVTVIDQPVKAAWVGDKLYLEAHPTLAQADSVEQEGKVSTYEFTQKDLNTLLEAAGAYTNMIQWDIVRAVIRERRGIPVVVAQRPIAINASEAPAAEDSAAVDKDRS